MIRSVFQHFRCFTSLVILAIIASMFVIFSCGGGPVQFNQSFGYHPTPDSCEEHHLSQSADAQTIKGIFDGVSVPDGKVFLAAIFVAIFFSIFPALPERYNARARIALHYHRHKRWVWARHTPFSSSAFFPYFAATRDQ